MALDQHPLPWAERYDIARAVRTHGLNGVGFGAQLELVGRVELREARWLVAPEGRIVRLVACAQLGIVVTLTCCLRRLLKQVRVRPVVLPHGELARGQGAFASEGLDALPEVRRLRGDVNR